MRGIRVSLGTAISLGLKEGALPSPPTTAYLMLGENCLNNCAFCTQARDADSSGELLSRVTWPSFGMGKVINSFKQGGKNRFDRICIQCLNDPIMLGKLEWVVSQLREAAPLPISVSVGPLGRKKLESLKKAGVERVGIAIDGGSEKVFAEVKGSGVGNPYTYESTWRAMDTALSVFGKGFVSTHLIIGIGETDKDVAQTLQKASDMGVTVSLFSFTPMKGTALKNSPPTLGRYRALQIMRNYVDVQGNLDPFGFDGEGKLMRMDTNTILEVTDLIDSFRTRGCPDCNRPYYNERPGKTMYNYPHPVDGSIIEEGISLAEEYVVG